VVARKRAPKRPKLSDKKLIEDDYFVQQNTDDDKIEGKPSSTM
jgi:hypothetical protein